MVGFKLLPANAPMGNLSSHNAHWLSMACHAGCAHMRELDGCSTRGVHMRLNARLTRQQTRAIIVLAFATDGTSLLPSGLERLLLLVALFIQTHELQTGPIARIPLGIRRRTETTASLMPPAVPHAHYRRTVLVSEACTIDTHMLLTFLRSAHKAIGQHIHDLLMVPDIMGVAAQPKVSCTPSDGSIPSKGFYK